MELWVHWYQHGEFKHSYPMRPDFDLEQAKAWCGVVIRQIEDMTGFTKEEKEGWSYSIRDKQGTVLAEGS